MKQTSVKVIKHQQREASAQPLAAASGEATDRDASRRAAATIKSWIDELRQRRQSETAALFRQLFKEGPLSISGAADAAPPREG